MVENATWYTSVPQQSIRFQYTRFRQQHSRILHFPGLTWIYFMIAQGLLTCFSLRLAKWYFWTCSLTSLMLFQKVWTAYIEPSVTIRRGLWAAGTFCAHKNEARKKWDGKDKRKKDEWRLKKLWTDTLPPFFQPHQSVLQAQISASEVQGRGRMESNYGFGENANSTFNISLGPT